MRKLTKFDDVQQRWITELSKELIKLKESAYHWSYKEYRNFYYSGNQQAETDWVFDLATKGGYDELDKDLLNHYRESELGLKVSTLILEQKEKDDRYEEIRKKHERGKV